MSPDHPKALLLERCMDIKELEIRELGSLDLGIPEDGTYEDFKEAAFEKVLTSPCPDCESVIVVAALPDDFQSVSAAAPCRNRCGAWQWSSGLWHWHNWPPQPRLPLFPSHPQLWLL